MNLLAIDAACSVLSVAVSRGEEIFQAQTPAGMKHSELVMDLINTQTEKAGLKPDELNGILCMGGPGSFTGLRIGFSISKGLALSMSVPFVPVPTLECIAYQISGAVIPVIQARKDAFFFAFFKDGRRIIGDADGTIEQIAEVLREKIRENVKITITGPDAEMIFYALPDELKCFCGCLCKNSGYAKELILIAKNKNLFYNDNTAFLYSGPEYIRKTDAEINLL
ncbi:MAG: tRNA (adenosine(37)-N6)-threonylcarbamoyltransferase complex dimerization subunit type 1 TsaB [Treponema sp.]|jgi:tRNA threonylcarbamoyladenosine biosynthesis protein TsaB|nr:tRNA (adenosine(37)-N6)-threonylcarbamoyltransferase complex dimerization subunit type 1 TsaB [Treponema sp.]